MSLSTRKKPKFNRKKIITVVAVLAVIALGAGAALWYSLGKNSSSEQQTTNPVNTTNLDPPTAEEKQEADQNKSDITKDQQNDTNAPATTQPGQKIDAKPFIVYVGQDGDTIELNGYTGAVFEDGGKCTATFTKGTLKVTREVTGFADARHTTCPPISIPRSDFSQTGSWTVTLSYDSTTATGTSAETTLVIK